MFIMCFVSVCLQDWVCCRENADQLVYVSPLQVSEGNLNIWFVTFIDILSSCNKTLPQAV